MEMSESEIEEFLRAQVVGRVGCHTPGTTYVVPVIYAWDDGCAYVYSVEGQKISMMRENPEVCFEVDEYLNGGGWRSVIIQGTFEELGGSQAARTLQLLASRFAHRAASSGGSASRQRPRAEGRVPVAFRIRATAVTGRKVNRSVEAAAQRRIGRILAGRRARRSAAASRV